MAHQEVRLNLLKELVQLGLSILQRGAGLVVLLLPAAEEVLVHVLVGQRQRPQTVPSKLLSTKRMMTLQKSICVATTHLPRIILSN